MSSSCESYNTTSIASEHMTDGFVVFQERIKESLYTYNALKSSWLSLRIWDEVDHPKPAPSWISVIAQSAEQPYDDEAEVP